MRWHTHYHSGGTGSVYQGRFKAFPVQEGEHFYTVLRYVERNALRAGLVPRAEDWRWGSLWQRCWAPDKGAALLSGWPAPLAEDWVEQVNAPQTEAELEAVRRSVARNRPYGAPSWQADVAPRLGLAHTLRPPGRPRKAAPPPP